MKRIPTFLLIAATIVLAACGTPAKVPPPVTQPSGEERFLVDPRIGAPAPPPNVDAKFDLAWRFVLADDRMEATKRLVPILQKTPNYLPAQLAPVVFFIRDRQFDRARDLLDSIVGKNPQYTAAEIYRAEIAVAEGDTRRAYDLYRSIAGEPNAPPLARERVASLQRTLFDRLVSGAQSANDREAIRMLREALELDPSSNITRIQLAQKLLATRDFDEAHRALEPLINGSDADRTDVQAILAEVEIGRGRYQEAIVRYERLAHRDPRYAARLEQIKDEFAAANMPLQYQRAVEAESITRADLAVLMYWKIIPILALGIYAVDPVTRRVGASTPVNATSLARISARVLLLRGANCARQATSEPGELARAEKVLAACSVADPILTLGADAPVSGRSAAAVMEQIDRALR